MPYTFYGQGKYLDDDAKAQRMILVGEDGEPPESGGDASAANQTLEIAAIAASDDVAATLATAQPTAIGTTATLIIAARVGPPKRKWLMIVFLATKDVYLGVTGVTTATGVLFPAQAGSVLIVPSSAAVYGVVASGTLAFSYLEGF